MKKAAALGVVDFREAKLFDRKWWRRLNWLLEEVEEQELRHLIMIRIQQHMAALDYHSGKQVFDHHWTTVNSLYAKWTNTVLPWIGVKEEKTQAQLFATWKKAYAHLSHEELEARAKLTASSLKPQKEAEPIYNETTMNSCWYKPNR